MKILDVQKNVLSAKDVQKVENLAVADKLG